MNDSDAIARLSVTEVFGLRPLRQTAAQAALALFGDARLPPSRFDASSLKLFTPRLAVATWLGRAAVARRVVITNLFNRTQTPPAQGWSVRVTNVRDFRGGRMTYDSHNGVDFAIPPGTLTVAAAAGRVVAIRREWNRGGLKLYLDHGEGLFTSHNHLARTLVRLGDSVARGQPVALTGYSGVDGFTTFPWVAPHVHYNTYLDGVQVDPFATPGETSLWRVANDPRPAHGQLPDDDRGPTVFDRDRVAALLDALDDPRRRAELGAIPQLERRAIELMLDANIYPTRFRLPEPGRLLFAESHARAPHLDLPFRADDFDGVVFADDAGFRRR